MAFWRNGKNWIVALFAESIMAFTCVAVLTLSLAADDGFPLDVKTAALAATVRIEGAASGSGVIIGRDDTAVYILTAAHVAGDRERVMVITFTGAPDRLTAERVYKSVPVVARARMEDLALLRISTRDKLPEGVRLCPRAAVPWKPVRILALGCDKDTPDGYADEVQPREVIRKKLGRDRVLFWEANTPPAAGRSGGALVNTAGQLLGICTGTDEEAGGKGYYCHAYEIMRFLKSYRFEWLVEGKRPEKKRQ